MKRMFSDHGMGVAAGLVLLAVGLVLVRQLFFTISVDEVFSYYAWRNEPPAQWLPPATEASAGLENQSTAVVENPYGETPERNDERLLGLVMMVVTFLAAGATAARIGPRVAAWRGALTGVLAGIGFAAIYRAPDFPAVATACLGCGAVTYMGGGLARLIAWAPLRKPLHMKLPFSEHWTGIAAGVALLGLGAILCSVFYGRTFWEDAEPPLYRMIVYAEEPRAGIVENRYGLDGPDVLGDVAIFSEQTLVAMILMVFVGAVAARVGSRVAAWRGVLPAIATATVVAASWASTNPNDILTIGLIGGLLAYAGGGLAKLAARARSRAA